MHKHYLFISLLLFQLIVFSQVSNNTFLIDEVNIGIVREDAGIQQIRYQFKGLKESGFKIDTVITSCGCLATSWTNSKTIVSDTGSVLIEFNPLNRLGVIKKEIDVVSGKDTIRLLLTGTVIPIKEKDLELNYKAHVGCLYFTSTSINYGEVYSNQLVEKPFLIYNKCDSPVILNEASHVFPPHISYEADTNYISPHSFLELKLTYNPKVANDWGYITNQLRLNSNQAKNKFIDLTTHATILEHFEDTLTKYPFIKFDTNHLSVGSLKQGQIFTHDFGFSNVGKDTLIIRKVQSTCDCVTTKLKDTVLAPGESSSLTVNFSTKNRSGTQKKYIYVISNSPYSAVTEIVLVSKVVD